MKKYYLIDIRRNLILEYSHNFSDMLDYLNFYLHNTKHTSIRILEVELWFMYPKKKIINVM